MNADTRIAVAGAMILSAGVLLQETAFSQAYPAKPVRIVVPFAPGGGADLMGRLVAQKLTESLKQQVIVDNRGGAAGRVGTEHVARAAPDGYTLLLATTSVLITAPALYDKLAYNVQSDFAPITKVASASYVLVVHPSVPVRTVNDLIALARSKPGLLNYSSSGPGGPAHLSAELFQSMAKVKMVHVPYKGSAPGTMAAMAGETDLMFSNILPAIPALQSGRLRPVAITSGKRSAILPGVPTVMESGLPGFKVETLYAVLVPAGTPREIIGRLNAVLSKSLQSAETRKRLQSDGSEVATSSPEELAKVIQEETAQWTRIIRNAGIKPE
jgi:tripartite-type tricarboxylate transporter receptor subunit TctC